MKKIQFTILLFAISILGFAQVKVRPGFKAGLNAASITDIRNSERKIGFQGALFVNIDFGRFYELQVEGSYSNQGYKTSNIYNTPDPLINQNYNHDITIHYIGAAVSNKFFFVPNLGLHFLAGPSLEINISDNTYDGIIPIDFALFGGIGYEFPIGLGIEARYKQGLIDVRDSYYDDYYDPDYEYGNNSYFNGNNKLNSVFQLSVYYKFGL